LLVAAAIACLIALPARTAHARRVTYGIAIGNNQAPANDSARSLRYADDDAVRYFDLFRRSGGQAALMTVFDSQSARRHARLASEVRAPTLAELRGTLQRFQANMERDRTHGDQPVLFLAYSGHGSTTEAGAYYLSFLDGGLTREMLHGILASLANVEVHLIVDACNASGVVGVRGAFDHEREAEAVPIDHGAATALLEARSLARFPMTGALVAASAGQEAHEWSRIESGVFTHEVVSALLGAADVNGDLRVEYSEVQAFVAAANRTVSDPRAVPDIVAHPPPGNPHAALSDLSTFTGSTFLVGKAGQMGRFSVRLADGRCIIDAHALGSERIVLALPSLSGTFVERGATEAEIPSGKVARFESLEFAPMRSAPRGALDRTLKAQLFRAAFTVDYYQGFVDSHDASSVDFGVPPRSLPADAATAPGSSIPRWVPTALLVASGAALATSAVSTGLALHAHSEFADTRLQRQAAELRAEAQTYTTVAIVTGVLAAGFGVGAFVTWPRETEASAGVSVGGRF
jgi:hypothetical protein